MVSHVQMNHYDTHACVSPEAGGAKLNPIDVSRYEVGTLASTLFPSNQSLSTSIPRTLKR